MNAKNSRILNFIVNILCMFGLLLPFNNAIAQILEPVSGHPVALNSILPADVLARAYLLSDEIELIRLELGRPEFNDAIEKVVNASPGEVYFQAHTSLVKVNQLLYELTGNKDPLPNTADIKSIAPFHVWKIINQAYEQVLKVKLSLQITEHVDEKKQSVDTTPSDVFSQVTLGNSELNSLLSQRFTPSDVYQKTTEAIHLMASLLATEPTVKRIPSPYRFERRKTPKDVYGYLYDVRSILINIMKYYDINFAEITAASDRDIKPSNVYDLASLIVANLHYVHSLKSAANSPSKVYPVARKTPSDVYQRVSILHQQLLIMEQLHELEPAWLQY